ncbi:MAG: hypothetical protein ACYDDF_04010 [Thermoplasmatota archaeon]
MRSNILLCDDTDGVPPHRWAIPKWLRRVLIISSVAAFAAFPSGAIAQSAGATTNSTYINSTSVDVPGNLTAGAMVLAQQGQGAALWALTPGSGGAAEARNPTMPVSWWLRFEANGSLDVFGGPGISFLPTLRVNGVVQLGPAELVTCGPSNRGSVAFVPGGAGSPDGIFACVKSYDNSYSWVTVASG